MSAKSVLHLTGSKGIYRAGQPHEQPPAHIGGLCAQRRHPSIQLSAAQKIIFCVLGFIEINKANQKHDQKIRNKSDQDLYSIHSISTSPKMYPDKSIYRDRNITNVFYYKLLIIYFYLRIIGQLEGVLLPFFEIFCADCIGNTGRVLWRLKQCFFPPFLWKGPCFSASRVGTGQSRRAAAADFFEKTADFPCAARHTAASRERAAKPSEAEFCKSGALPVGFQRIRPRTGEPKKHPGIAPGAGMKITLYFAGSSVLNSSAAEVARPARPWI